MRKSYLSWFWAIMEDGAWDVEASESVSSPESDHWKEIFFGRRSFRLKRDCSNSYLIRIGSKVVVQVVLELLLLGGHVGEIDEESRAHVSENKSIVFNVSYPNARCDDILAYLSSCLHLSGLAALYPLVSKWQYFSRPPPLISSGLRVSIRRSWKRLCFRKLLKNFGTLRWERAMWMSPYMDSMTTVGFCAGGFSRMGSIRIWNESTENSNWNQHFFVVKSWSFLLRFFERSTFFAGQIKGIFKLIIFWPVFSFCRRISARCIFRTRYSEQTKTNDRRCSTPET